MPVVTPTFGEQRIAGRIFAEVGGQVPLPHGANV